MGWRLESYYKRKAEVFSKKTGETFRDFSIPTEEEMAILDREVSDEEMLTLLQAEKEDRAREKEQWRIDEARKRVIEAARTLEEHISYAEKEYSSATQWHEQSQPYLYERARRSAENRKSYEAIRQKEIEDFKHVEAIVAKSKLDDRDISTLQAWMDSHREFGLASMTDEEYDDLFSDGRFYIHSTNFFRTNPLLERGDPRRTSGPRFFEALKDGYLIGLQIGVARGEPISGAAASERVTYFDSHLDLNRLRANSMPHFDYALARAEGNSFAYNLDRLPPVLLIAPARLLESHSVKEPRHFSQDDFTVPVGEHSGYISVGVGEGDAFGSANPDAMSLDHNIDLGLFVLVLPKVVAKKELIQDMLMSIIEDPRFARTPIVRLAHEASKRIPKEGVDFEDFMRGLFSRAIKASEKKGISIPSMPRLHFYEVSTPPGEDIVLADSPLRDVENGLQNFLDTHSITPSVERGFERDQTGQAFLPEQLRIEKSRLEQLADQIRRRLRALDKQPNTTSLAETRERAFALSFTREELDNIVESDSYTPEKLIELFEKDFKSQYEGGVGVPEASSLREYTLRVLQQFERYYADKRLPGEIPQPFFRLLLALHDIGKPRAVQEGDKSRQHIYTQHLAREILKKLQYTPEQRALADAILGGDTIGRYMKGEEDAWSTIQNLRAGAEKSGLSLKDYFDLVVTYYKVDAGSYGRDAGGDIPGIDHLFVFDHKKGAIHFSQDAMIHFMYLAQEVEWHARKKVDV